MVISNRKLYFFILYAFFLVLAIVLINSCKPVLKQDIASDSEEAAEEIGKPIGNNYQGLRVETLNLDETVKYSPRIICFGNSVTFGWNVEHGNSYPGVLKRLLEGHYKQVEVINSGIGGNTIIDARDRLDDDVFYFSPHLVIINFGLNDGTLLKTNENGNKNNTNKSLLDEREFPSRVDLPTFKKTYDDIIGKLRSEEIGVIILGTNPILDSMFDDRSYFEKQVISFEKYNQEARLLADSYGIAYIDLWEIFLKGGQVGQFMAEDGLHPNEAGLELIAESVYQLVKDGSFFEDMAID